MADLSSVEVASPSPEASTAPPPVGDATVGEAAAAGTSPAGEGGAGDADRDELEDVCEEVEAAPENVNFTTVNVEPPIIQKSYGADEVAALQNDPKTPYHSTYRDFADPALGLTPELVKGAKDLGLERPSQVQAVVLPKWIKEGRDLVVQSQNGTGKTAAFLLGVLARLKLVGAPNLPIIPQAIVVANTRELATQIAAVAEKLSKYMNPKPVITLLATTQASTEVSGAVVIGTPGVLCHALERKLLVTWGLKMMVVDEADELFLHTSSKPHRRGGRGGGGMHRGMSREEAAVLRIAKMVDQDPERSPKMGPMRRMALSATEPEGVLDLYIRFLEPCAKAGREPVKLAVKSLEEMQLRNVKQFYVNVQNMKQKLAFIETAWDAASRNDTIIFVERKSTAEELARYFNGKGLATRCLTGNLTPQERDDVLDAFRRQQCRVLITTNLLSRGVDVPLVSVVVNFDVPRQTIPGSSELRPDPPTYLHRVGRAGRFGRPGLAVTLVDGPQERELLEAVLRMYPGRIKETTLEAKAIYEMFQEAAEPT